MSDVMRMDEMSTVTENAEMEETIITEPALPEINTEEEQKPEFSPEIVKIAQRFGWREDDPKGLDPQQFIEEFGNIQKSNSKANRNLQRKLDEMTHRLDEMNQRFNEQAVVHTESALEKMQKLFDEAVDEGDKGKIQEYAVKLQELKSKNYKTTTTTITDTNHESRYSKKRTDAAFEEWKEKYPQFEEDEEWEITSNIVSKRLAKDPKWSDATPEEYLEEVAKRTNEKLKYSEKEIKTTSPEVPRDKNGRFSNVTTSNYNRNANNTGNNGSVRNRLSSEAVRYYETEIAGNRFPSITQPGKLMGIDEWFNALSPNDKAVLLKG